LPSYAEPSLNLVALVFTFGVALACGVVFGLVPALRSSRVDLVDSLKEGSRGSVSGFGRGGRLGAQQLLVVGETAVALVLLIGAGLYVRSLQQQLNVTPGFDPTGVLRARLALPLAYTPQLRTQAAEQLHARLASIPSVQAVAVGSDLPLAGASNAGFVFVPEANQAFRSFRHSVNPQFFSALGIRVVAGRAFENTDRATTPPVVIINDATARRFWRNESAVGKRIRLGNDPTGPEATIVGVVSDVRYRDLTTPLATSEPDVYFPIAQRPAGGLQIAVRSNLPTEALSGAIRREVAGIDPTVPLFGVQGLDQLLAQQTSQGRFASSLLTAFGAAALVLTAVGLYGVLAFLVSLRRREIGIRIALGATQNRVLGGVVGQGLRLVALGVVIGVIVAAGATRWIATQLYGVGAHDPLVFVAVPAVLLGVAALASSIPARRAARVDPQIALRSE
jgi:putative ABC transport system permease protein